MASIPFTKVEGCGNDFIVVDLRPGAPAAEARPSPADPEVAKLLCDRHFGIGADGVLAIGPGDGGDARMRVINADGSEAEMCGNGIRCVTKYLYEKDPTLRRPVLKIDTGAGQLACAVEVDGGAASPAQVRSVAVEMGRPRLQPAEIPLQLPAAAQAIAPVLRQPIESQGRSFAFTAVSMGNPHAVIFIDDPAADLRALAELHGPGLERHPFFPRRTNVEFARVRAGTPGTEIDLVVWERGCGITLACGTGACATVVAACLEGRTQPRQETPVHLPGGALFITVRTGEPAPGGGPLPYTGVTMRGPARIVFEAEVDTARLGKRA